VSGSSGTASQAYTIVIVASTSSCSLSPGNTPTTTTYALPAGHLGGYSYSTQLTPSSGCGTYGGTGRGDFSVTGPLPPGLDIYSDGGIRGTPTAGGTYNFTITITTATATASQAYSITVS
jgi:hypothetical protein